MGSWACEADKVQRVTVLRDPERILYLLQRLNPAIVISFILPLYSMGRCRSVASELLCFVDTNLRQHVQICKDITFILFGHTTWPVSSHFLTGIGNWAPLQWKCRVSITGLPGSPYILFFFFSCIIYLIIVLVSLFHLEWWKFNLGQIVWSLLPFSPCFHPNSCLLENLVEIPNLLHHLGIWYLAYQTWAVHCQVVFHCYPQDTSIAHYCSSHATLEHVDWWVWDVGPGIGPRWTRCKVSFLLVYLIFGCITRHVGS